MTIYDVLRKAVIEKCDKKAMTAYCSCSKSYFNKYGDCISPLERNIIEALADMVVESLDEILNGIDDEIDEIVDGSIDYSLDYAKDHEEKWLSYDDYYDICRDEAKNEIDPYIENWNIPFDFIHLIPCFAEDILDIVRDTVSEGIESYIEDEVYRVIDNYREEGEQRYSEDDDEEVDEIDPYGLFADDEDPDDEDSDECEDESVEEVNTICFIDDTKCRKGKCLFCMARCPKRAISFINGTVFIDQSKCDGCGRCKEKCPCGAVMQIEEEDSSLYDDLD